VPVGLVERQCAGVGVAGAQEAHRAFQCEGRILVGGVLTARHELAGGQTGERTAVDDLGAGDAMANGGVVALQRGARAFDVQA